jgi:diguanylate cyclase (GGDEF)-like protein
MAVRSLLKSWQGSAGSDRSTQASSASVVLHDDSARLAMFDGVERAGTTWFWATDAEGRLTYISATACERMTVDVAELTGQPFTVLFETDPDDSGERSERPLQFRIGAHARLADTVVRLAGARSAVPVWWSLNGGPLFDDAGAFLGYRGVGRDVTREYSRKVEDSRAAEYDSLTGLANRHRMVRRLDQILAAFRSSSRPCAVLMIDLDRFKLVNDTLGHLGGDELLREVAQRLRRVVASRGEIGRLGGDEFQIILSDVDDRGMLGDLATKIISTISQPYFIDGAQASIGASIGMAIAPYDATDREELVHSADLALYAAKNGGRGAFRFHSADLRDEREERARLELDLRAALDGASTANSELDLHYQPVVRTADNMVVGCEALMRWNHAERGMIGPEVFIAIAEETGLIDQLGAWALQRACADAMTWPDGLRVAVNVSAIQFAHGRLVADVADALAASGIEPDRLELELTESVFLGDDDETRRIFAELKGLGVRLALDDFGTGYSSLGYLREAPFDKLKVDRSFVNSCALRENNSSKIIAAIIGLGDALGMETVVEGVEAFDQLELVCGHGARYIQGYLFSPALDRADLAERMRDQTFRIAPEGPARHRPERRSVFRRIGVIHEDYRYEALLRDLSATGARVDGLVGVPVGAGLVLDLGGGQLAVCTVVRVTDASIGVEFEMPLVSDGAGGLVTRHRVPPMALAAVAARGAPGSAPRFIEVKVTRDQGANILA